MNTQARPQLLVDAETQRVLEANPAAARTYGYRPEELAGMPLSAVWPAARAMEPFYSTKGEGGTGLGLWQVYGFMHRLGGTTRIESAPGRGTVVTLVFPRAANRPA